MFTFLGFFDRDPAGVPKRKGQASFRIRGSVGALGIATTLFVLAAQLGVAYRFTSYYSSGPRTPTAAFAVRWDAADMPVQFRLLDNNLGHWPPPPVLRDAVENAIAAWNSVPTSRFRLELAEALYQADRTTPQGINEIGFSLWPAGHLFVKRGESSAIHECDISLERERDPGRSDEHALLELQWVLTHQLGHCLGLTHSEQYPMSDHDGSIPTTYWPPPLMSFGPLASVALSDDDRVGVSLLYPTPDFARSRGAVAGRVVTASGDAVRFCYVQALRVGDEPGAGPGAFTNEDGYFVIEGLPPGNALLWVHPILPSWGNAHGDLKNPSPWAGPEAIQDQWRWAKVTVGETSVLPTIVTTTGRGSDSP